MQKNKYEFTYMLNNNNSSISNRYFYGLSENLKRGV